MAGAFRPPASAVVLAGFMGTGKSTVAGLLAERWGLASVDTDALIAERAGKSIVDLFAVEGEQHFRDRETQVLRELAQEQALVISSGGGMLLRPENGELLRAMGPIICLHASPEVILARTADSNNRPLLSKADPREEIRRLLAGREQAYSQADYHLATDELSPEQAAEQVEEIVIGDSRGVFLVPGPVELPVELGEDSYPIHIGEGMLATAGRTVCPEQAGQRAAVIGDDNVAELYAAELMASLAEGGWDAHLLSVAPGEASKTLAAAGQLCARLAEAELDRSSVIFALGGGMIGDLAGFVAAIYMRGIEFVQVPTSLLAQVDASVGGKVAVDLPRGKNLVGAFHQPRAVIVDTRTLASLPDDQFRAGLAEVIKHAAIADEELFAYLESNLDRIMARDRTGLKYLLARNCQIKAEVVSTDPHERDRRAVLNFGHTIGHSLERAAPEWQLSHGEAIAAGMIAESQVAVERGLAEPAVVERLSGLIEQAGLRADLGQVDLEAAGAAMAADKKIRQGRLTLPVVPQIGRVVLTDQVQLTDLRGALEQLLA